MAQQVSDLREGLQRRVVVVEAAVRVYFLLLIVSRYLRASVRAILLVFPILAQINFYTHATPVGREVCWRSGRAAHCLPESLWLCAVFRTVLSPALPLRIFEWEVPIRNSATFQL